MLFNARKEAGILNPGTGRFLELDVYLPSLNLGFEYQVRLLMCCMLSLTMNAGETPLRYRNRLCQ